MWAILAISYACLTACHTLVLATAIRTIQQSSLFVFINSLFCLVAVAIACGVTLGLTNSLPYIRPLFWLYIGLAALTQVIGLRLVVNAYATTEVSQVAPLGVLTPALVAIAEMPFLHEPLGIRTILGLLIIVAGAYVLEIKTAKEALLRPFTLAFQRKNPISEAIRGYLLARCIWVSFPIFLKLALQNMTPLSPYVVSIIIVGCMSIMTLPTRRADLQKVPVFAKSLFWIFVLSALIVVLQQYTEIGAYAKGNVAAVSAIFKLEIPLAILFNGKLFSEQNVTIRLISGIIMCGGAALIGT